MRYNNYFSVLYKNHVFECSKLFEFFSDSLFVGLVGQAADENRIIRIALGTCKHTAYS